MTNFANSTHPEAKPRAEREHDDLVWGVASSNPLKRTGKVWIVTMNGDDVAGPMDRTMAHEIVRLHNQAVPDREPSHEALESYADEAAYFDGFRDSDPAHMTPAMRAIAAAHEPDFEELQSAYEDLRDREAAIEGAYEDERRRKNAYAEPDYEAPASNHGTRWHRGMSLRAAAARIADSQEFFNTDEDGYEDPF